MNPARFFARIGVVAVLAMPVLAAADGNSARMARQQQSYLQALQALREGHPASAYGRLVALADEGHLPSARLAMMLYEHGQSLYGSQWSASPEQQLHWNAMVVNGARRRVPDFEIESGD